MAADLLPSSANSSYPDVGECPNSDGFAWRNVYLTELTKRHLIALICVYSVAIIPTIVLNALVIFVVATRRPLQTISNILLACLAGTDLLAGLVVQPIALAVEAQRLSGAAAFCTLQSLRIIAIFAQSFASLNHLVIISIDRYIAIKHSLRYQDIVTKSRIKKAVLVAWTVAVFLTLQEIGLAVMESGTDSYSAYLTFVGVLTVFVWSLCIGAICYCYGYIFTEIRRQQKRLQTEQLPQEEVERIKKDNRAAITLAIIIGVLVITYLPSLTFIIIFFPYEEQFKPSVVVIVSSWVSTSVVLGSLANPIIYCWRNTKLRHAFLEICHLRQPENVAPPIEMVEIKHHRTEIQPSNKLFTSRK